MRTRFIAFVLSAPLAIACFAFVHAQAPASAPTLAQPESLSSPAGADSSEPLLSVTGTRAILSWIETKDDRATVRFAERTATGWSEPHDVVSGTNFFVSGVDVPSVRALADGSLVAHWLVSNSQTNPEGYDVKLARSKDGGKTWIPLATPHHDKTETQHGFVTLFPAGQGFGLVWLDGRKTNPEKETGDMMLRATRYDASGKQGADVLVDPRVCECCSTSVATTADGAIVAYRDRSATEIRDIYVSRLVRGVWSMPTRVTRDNWNLQACPINGPAVSASGQNVAVASYAVLEDLGRASVTFSHDGGRTFGQSVRVDDKGSFGRVGVELLADGAAAVSYVAVGDKGSNFTVRVVQPDGKKGPSVVIAPSGGARIPRIARVGDELLFAWTESGTGGMTKVQTARTKLK